MRRSGFALAVALVVAFNLVPFLWLVSTALKSPEHVLARPPTWLPDLDTGFFAAALSEHGLLTCIRNSAIVATATTLLTVLLAAPAAYALSRLRIPGRGAVLALVLAVSMFPQVALVGGLYGILRDLSLLNTYPGLFLPYTALALPLAIWVLASFFREIPLELEEAARIDGCGALGTLFRVFLPVAAPALFTVVILVFIFSWNEFFLALLFATDPAVRTLPVGIALFPSQYEVPWGELAAAAVLATLPLVALVLLLQRKIVRGVTAGAVKG